ncbi:PepSY-associated TM helix domain-containing protein [Cognaticolwellia mytili]|uniref:PepSY-associated TM helix domain-containing protein n=1 Tax=Cognaticolwellia mytili TaxID=1888913 RepID=UPI000A175C86|nr:PepSY-associated TM helix domain-containing protein [Cognaticolwellia mytili]
MVKSDFRRTMIWLHTYSSLVLGWLCFTVFLTGTLSFYNTEITQWMQPEYGSKASAPDHVNQALALLHVNGQDKKHWSIKLPFARSNEFKISMADRTGRGSRRTRTVMVLDVDTLESITPRETEGADFFTDIHYTLLLDDVGKVIVVIVAMFMLVALFSGIFTHRRFFKDFFTMRFKRLSQALSDVHAVVGIITLPFFSIICFSGVVMNNDTVTPWSMEYHFDKGKRELTSAISARLQDPKPSGIVAKPITDFSVIVAVVNEHWGEGKIKEILFTYPFDKAGVISVISLDENTLTNKAKELVFSANSGELLASYDDNDNFSLAFERVLTGLHEAEYAPVLMRFILFLMGSAGTFLIASGLILWLTKRLEKVKNIHRGHALVERLNVSVLVGLPLAIMAYFYANRLIPAQTEDRDILELVAFFSIWLTVIAYSNIGETRGKYQPLLLILAIGFFALPIADFLIDSRFIMQALSHANINYLSVNLIFITTGILCTSIYRYLKGKQQC